MPISRGVQNRRWLLWLGFLVFFAFVGWFTLRPTQSSSEQELLRANIVLIIIDTLRADKLGAYGYPSPTSPELDMLAKKGVRFARTYSQSSWTRPSIASMLTSLYPRQVGVYKERGQLLHNRYTLLSEVLKENGYATYGITANPNINSSFNFHQGFDKYIDSAVAFDWMAPALKAKKKAYGKAPLRTARENFKIALRLAKKKKRNVPGYLQVNIMDVHEAFDPRVIQAEHKVPLGSEDLPYLQSIHQASAETGAFVEKLSDLPGWENTIFIITSDHGQGLGSHPHVDLSRDHGLLLYESQVRVPLILFHSKGMLPAGRIVRRPVQVLDMMPTILDFVGIKGPSTMRGMSLKSWVRGTISPPEAQHFFVETHFRHANAVGVYSKEWKYIEHRHHVRGAKPKELQRVGKAEDGLRTDLSEKYPDVARRLSKVLRRWEKRFPPAPATLRGETLPPHEIEQLKALGYIQ